MTAGETTALLMQLRMTFYELQMHSSTYTVF